jgi:hypothetical protein
MIESSMMQGGSGGNRRTEDDNRSMINQSMVRKMRTLVLKFFTTFKSDAEINSAKDRLAAYNKKDWTLLEGKDGVLVYADRKGLNLSRGKMAAEALQKSVAERAKSVMDSRA